MNFFLFSAKDELSFLNNILILMTLQSIKEKIVPDRFNRFVRLLNKHTKYIFTRILERFASIFYFNCEHVLIVNIEKQRKINFADFQNLKKFYKNKNIHKPSLGSRDVTQKIFGLDRFSRFDDYWIQTNRQTSQIYICL